MQNPASATATAMIAVNETQSVRDLGALLLGRRRFGIGDGGRSGIAQVIAVDSLLHYLTEVVRESSLRSGWKPGKYFIECQYLQRR